MSDGKVSGLRQIANAAAAHRDIWHGNGRAAWLRCLADEVMEAGQAIATSDMEEGRKRLATIGGICANWIDVLQEEDDDRTAPA